MADENSVPLQQGTDSTIPRLKLGELGNPGLVVIGGNVFEECQHELRWPYAVHTFTEMSKDASISAALSLVEMMIARVKWHVKVPGNATEDQKKKQRYLEQVMNDMDHSWFSFIREVVSFNRYGFSVHEKVFRRRKKINGSKYDDGLIGLKKLPIRAQDSIKEWKWSADGRNLEACIQTVRSPDTATQVKFATEDKKIPREKFLLFRTGSHKESPVGRSPLVGCWAAWKYKRALEEHEAIGVSQDMRGLKVLHIPPQYMAEDASENDKAIFEQYKRIMRQLHTNEQSGLILPQILDPDSRKEYFKLELLSVTGQKGYDINSIIGRYTNEIMTALFADLLKMGQNKVGSFALSDNKTNIMAMSIQAKLDEIKDVLNHDLAVQLFQLNGWDTSDMPEFEYGDLDERDLAVFAKALQQLKAVGLVAPTPGNINAIAETLQLPDRVEMGMEQEELNELLGKPSSNSGEGFASATGGLNGTANDVSEDDNSASNLSNQ